MTRSLHRSPFVLVLLLPTVAFLVIGRTVEIRKASEIAQPGGDQAEDGGAAVASLARDVLGHLAKRRFGLAGGSSAGAGLSEWFLMFTEKLVAAYANRAIKPL